MTSNGMSSIVSNFQAIDCYLIGNTRITRHPLFKEDHNSIVVGLSLWIGILLDNNVWSGRNAEVLSTTEGRIRKIPLLWSRVDIFPLGGLLTYLDDLTDMLLANLSSPTGFKAQQLLKEVKTITVVSVLNPLKGVIIGLLSQAVMLVEETGVALVNLVKWTRQTWGFLKKLDVNRPDLQATTKEGFFSFEKELASVVAGQREDSSYQELVTSMRQLFQLHSESFTMDPFLPKHGPGAVSLATTKSWYEKHTTAKTDARVNYLLGHAGLGQQVDYLPLLNDEQSTRTSRYICVPKTWKKLRGISAEPAELQFWQQGVLSAVDRLFRHDEWWSRRINLHSQDRSRKMALTSSLTESYATIDLSAASDSVSLQLVRDVFGNSHLGRWLLGTRSVHTSCMDSTVRISKFAPMGSACCFPVECMIFTLAAEVACSRTYIPSLAEPRQVCVFGDDIIIPYYAVHELFKILSTLGFSVNTEKSYWVGKFREACGVEAWNGVDIAPCRFSSCKCGPIASNSDHAQISSMVAMANSMFVRGLHTARALLLTVLFEKKVQLKKGSMSVQRTIFATFSGECSTLISPCPTNFQLVRKFDLALQTYMVRRIVWQERPTVKTTDSIIIDQYSMLAYTEWLIRHQANAADFDALWSEGWIDSKDVNPYSRLPLGIMMIPTVKWVIQSTYDCL